MIEVPRHVNLRIIPIMPREEAIELAGQLESFYQKETLRPAAEQLMLTVNTEHDSWSRVPIPAERSLELSKLLTPALQQYSTEVVEFACTWARGELIDEGFIALRFGEGDFHQLYQENISSLLNGRLLTTQLWLNNSYRGGELWVYPSSTDIEPEPGQLVMMPASWEYGYVNRPVTAGVKWILINYIRLAEPKIQEPHPANAEDGD